MGQCFVKGNQDEDNSKHNLEFDGGNVHRVTSKESWDEKLSQASKEHRIVIANFSASWCGPCRTMAPLYCELSEQHPSLVFLTIDVDELSDLSASWSINATPTFFFLKDGTEIDKLVGANKQVLEKKITALSSDQEGHDPQ